MRRHLETLANLATLATCGAIVYIMFVGSGAPARMREGPSLLQKGDWVAVNGIPVDRANRTLLMVLHSGCKYCTESMPFYRRLTRSLQAEQQLVAQVVVVTGDDAATANEYLKGHDVSVHGVVSLTRERGRELRIPGTPALILIDRSGKVQNVWFGKLDARAEAQVEQALLGSES